MATPSTRPVSTFPVEWSEVTVTGQAFTLDSIDMPAPTVPLEATAFPWFGDVFGDGLRALGIPMRAHETVYVNHYAFSRTVFDEPTPEQVAAIERAVRDAIAVQMDRWLGEFRPRAEALIAVIKAFDADSPALEELPAQLDALDAAQAELWTIHFRIVIGMLLSMQGFGEFYADLFEAPEQEAYALLAGGVTESTKTAFALADLAERARELGLDTVILHTPDDELMAALAGVPGGTTFMAEVSAFLDTFGYRQDLYRMTSPTWLERPASALAQVRACLRGDVDVRARQARVASEAEAAARRARERLALYPQPVWRQFETMLAQGRQGAFLEEEHHFYIDQHSTALLRLTCLKVGRRLVREGHLDAPEEVMMLEAGELRSVMLDAAGARVSAWPRRLVHERQRELEIAAAMTPPPFLGDPGGLDEAPDNPVARAIRNHFGGPPVSSERPGELRGTPASRGVATGRARIARSLHEAKSLLPGEILVATTTMPPWTPLFGIAAAVVAETGGALSHCAIAAREYGIPAVVGVHGATREIPEGATVTVDGAAGTVRIE
jgi:phosphohistidine swiveling domain-containing protein